MPEVPAPSILLVEDDQDLCSLMKEYFAENQIRLDVVNDGTRGLSRALEEQHDLVLLDVMLPGLDGFEILRQLRRRSSVPVIMLTARSEQSSRILGLDTGADDYLPKPFGPEELLARVRAVLRRSSPKFRPPAEVIEVNGVRLVTGSREAWADGSPVELTAIEYDILEFLIRAAGQVVSRDQLSSALHQRESNPFERSLDVHISHLRKKLDPQRNVIRTIRGSGYLFCTESTRDDFK